MTAADQAPGEPGAIAAVRRFATLGDAGEILTLQRAAYLAEAQIYRDPFLPPLVESLAEVADAVRSGNVLLVTNGHRIVGAVRITVKGQTAHIGRLIVAPDLQGRGIGSELLRAAELAAPPDVTRFELFTGADSTRNLTMYVRMGYTPFDRRHLSGSVDLVFLERARS